MMDDPSIELNSARAILSTYRQVHDTPQTSRSVSRAKLQQKNKELEKELMLFKEKYIILQKELINRNKKLENLHQELFDKTTYLSKLQEDFENAIYQLAQRKEV